MREFPRRNLAFLLPALTAMNAPAQAPATPGPTLASKVFQHAAIPYRASGSKKGRRFFAGRNRSGFGIEMHETILAPGTETHPPHKHPHEEIVTVLEGAIEFYIEGKTEKAEAGSVVYIASNEMHNMRSVGTEPSRYYVVELRGDAS
jgi:XRE family transcriptional regulator, regulator of sulfur utilization